MRNTKLVGLVGKFVAGAAVAASVFSGVKPASATPAGLTFYPSTDIYGNNVFHFDSDVFTNTNFNNGVGTNLGLTYGFGRGGDRPFGRTEVGFDFVTNTGVGENDNRLLFNIKSQVFNNDARGERVVIGAYSVGGDGEANASNNVNIFPANIAYILGSKTFSFGRIHLGIAQSLADREDIATPDGDDDRTYLQFGYDKVFANGKLQFTFDGYTGQSAASVLAPGIIYYVNDKASFQLGFVRYNDKSVSPRNQLYIGFDYNFGRGAETPAAAPAPEDNTKQPVTGGQEPERPATP